MTPLPAGSDRGDLVAWRLDRAGYAASWDSGEGAFQAGGRWNSAGTRAVYCSIDPSTAILEVAVHKGFRALDTVPHVMTTLQIQGCDDLRIVWPDDVPNPNWLRPGFPSAGQQRFGDALLAKHCFLLIPSAVSPDSWNVVFTPSKSAAAYRLRQQGRFALDTRLHPPTG
jgi:RES domain-containing protein